MNRRSTAFRSVAVLLTTSTILCPLEPAAAAERADEKVVVQIKGIANVGGDGKVEVSKKVTVAGKNAPTLEWKNGDELKGEILEADGKTIQWKAPDFRDPFLIRQEQLQQIDFPEKEQKDKTEPTNKFRFVLRNGDRVFGDLLSIDNSRIVLTSDRFPKPITLERSSIDRIEQVRGNRMRFSGPVDLDQWKTLGRNRKVTEWEMGLRGEFMTNQWHADLFRPIDFPNAVEVNFAIHTPGDRPNFEIAFLQEGDKGPRVETWGETVVLTFGADFAPILTLSEEDRDIHLRIFWNQQSGELKACDATGKLLASLQGVKAKYPATGENKRASDDFLRGFGLTNRTPLIRLTHVNVREWNGNDVPVIDVSQPRIEMASGDTYFGLNRLSLSNGSGKLNLGGRDMTLDTVSEIIFSTKESGIDEQKIRASSHVAWYDGSTISGDLRTISDGRVVLDTEWNPEPVEARLTSAKQIIFPTSTPDPIEQLDELKIGELTLHGRVQGGNDDEPPGSLITWQPVGAENASPLDSGTSAEVVRGAFAAGLPVITNSRLYLSNGEMVVGRLISIDGKKVNFISETTGQIAIAQEEVRAVDVGGDLVDLNGFSDEGWEIFSEDEKAVEMTDDKVIFRSDGFGHPNLLIGDRIQFDGDWEQSYGAMTVRLFCASNDTSSASTDVILAAQGNRMFVGKLRKGGAFSFSGEQVPIRDNRATFEILARPDKVEIKVNGKSALSIPIEAKRASGNGIYFRMGGGWQGWNNKENVITLSKFSVERTPGYVPTRIIDSDARANALKIPRFHRDNPPTHLLIAPNGDLLRGELLALTTENARFVSRDATFDVPRSRISSVVWLREKPGAELPESISTDEKEADYAEREANPGREAAKKEPLEISHQFMLHDGSRLRLAAKTINGEEFTGESAILGECKVTLPQVKEMKVGPAAIAAADKQKKKKSLDLFAFEDWNIEYTPDPKIPNGEGEATSPLIGKAAPEISLGMLDESKFKLSALKGKVVVLDFWATWCGPCIRAMPDVKAAVEAFPEDSGVVLCAVNQAESPQMVSKFFENRGWKDIPVAFDFTMSVSKEYGVKGIPFTVVVGKDGKVAWVHNGYSEELKAELAKAIAVELAK